MEGQPSTLQSSEPETNQTPPVQPSKSGFKSPDDSFHSGSRTNGIRREKLPWIIIIILLVLVGILGGYFVLNQMKQTVPTPTPDQKACSQEAKLCPDGVTSVGRTGPKCEFEKCPDTPTSTSTGFNDFLDNLSNTVKNEDFDAIISLQRIDEIECDPTSEGIVQAICEGESKDTKKSGYWYGPTQSEFSIVPKDKYLTYLKEIFDQNGPYAYSDSKQMGNKAIAIYKGKKLQNANLYSMIGFYVTNKEGAWQTSYFVYGPLTEDFNPISEDHFTFN